MQLEDEPKRHGKLQTWVDLNQLKSVQNYLSFFSKGLKSVSLSRMPNFSDRHSTLKAAQYVVFLSENHRSTEYALLEQKYFILNLFENKIMKFWHFDEFQESFRLLKSCSIINETL